MPPLHLPLTVTAHDIILLSFFDGIGAAPLIVHALVGKSMKTACASAHIIYPGYFLVATSSRKTWPRSLDS